MKKSVIIAVLGIGFAVASYGQGQVNFLNYYSSTQPTGVSYGNGPDAGSYVGPEISAILLVGPASATSISQLTPVAGSSTAFGLGAASGPGALGTGAGWFIGPTLNVEGGVPGIYAFAIEATGVLNSLTYTGYSSIFDGPTQPTSTSPTPNIPAGLEADSFTVTVPEPTTLALSGLGALSLLAFRRHKV
jgi:hypothetical protein